MYLTYIDSKTSQIKTIKTKNIRKSRIDKVDNMLPYIYDLYNDALELLSQGNVQDRYTTTYIRKKSGKLRRIDEPDKELKLYQKKLAYVFSTKLDLIFPKNSYAYVKNRTTKQAVEVHINANSMVKTDIKDFFTNCCFNTLMYAMENVYPFCLMDTTVLKVILKPCMLSYNGNYGLPQGAPSSPILSNIAMIPVDFKLSNIFEIDRIGRKKYTRYADDIIISSSRNSLHKTFKNVHSILTKTLNTYNFNLNNSKTHYVRLRNGGNNGEWILGMHMLSEKVLCWKTEVDNNGCKHCVSDSKRLTIGHNNKQILKATIWTFLADTRDGKLWSKEKVRQMVGKVNYWKYIEPDYVIKTIEKYENKSGIEYQKAIVNILNS